MNKEQTFLVKDGQNMIFIYRECISLQSFQYIEPIMSRLNQTHFKSRKLPVFIQIETLPFTESMSNAERRQQADIRYRRMMSPYMRQCLRLWQMLQEHQFGFFFRWQVNPDVLGLPNYWKVVRRPISLAIIWHKLHLNFYKKHEEFDADVRLMLANALTFNQDNRDIMEKIHNYADFYVKKYDEMAQRLTRETLVDENKGRVHVRVTLEQKMRGLRRRCFTEQKLQQMGGKLGMLSDDKRRQLHKAMGKKFSEFNSSKENIALEGMSTQQLVYLANLARNIKPATFKPMSGKEKQAHKSLGHSERREEDEESSFEIEEDE